MDLAIAELDQVSSAWLKLVEKSLSRVWWLGIVDRQSKIEG